MLIDYNDETESLNETQYDELTELIKYTLKGEELDKYECELSVSFVSNDRIKKLNNDYRGIDETTDVLSFPLIDLIDDMAFIRDTGQPLTLGDIIISLDRAKEQAQAFNHSYRRELSFLVIHGLLHLLGYTHDNDEDEVLMFNRQNEILEAFQIERE